MKYNKILLIGLIFSMLSDAMEQPLASCTRVNIRKGSLYDVDGEVDIIVVGMQEQRRLNRSFRLIDEKGYEVDEVGAIQFMRPNLSYVNVMKKEDDSDSVEETDHHPCNIIKHRDYNYYEKRMNSCVLAVVEPALRNMWYDNQRENYQYCKKHDEFYGEDAIIRAECDLFQCYQNVLTEGLQKLGDKKNKSIAIPTLSTSVGLPRKDAAMCAMGAIIGFIKDHPGEYSRIMLFVKKRFEYDQYRSVLMNHKSFIKDTSRQNDQIIAEIDL